MTVLGIETSTQCCSVGIYSSDGRMDERFLLEPRVHSEKLITLIDGLIRGSSGEQSRIDGIAVSIGPGSFTGLRIGLSTAKGLACSLSSQIVAVPTFDGYVQSLWEEGVRAGRVLVAVDARQGEYYSALYEFGPDAWKNIQPAFISSSRDILERMRSERVPVILTDTPDIFRANGTEGADIRLTSSCCRGGIIAQLGWHEMKRGGFSELDTLEPYYLKAFVARKLKSA